MILCDRPDDPIDFERPRRFQKFPPRPPRQPVDRLFLVSPTQRTIGCTWIELIHGSSSISAEIVFSESRPFFPPVCNNGLRQHLENLPLPPGRVWNSIEQQG